MKLTLIFLMVVYSTQSFAEGRLRARLREIRDKNKQIRAVNKTSNIAGSGDFTLSLEHGGLLRNFKVHVPPSYKKNLPMPLLIALHGGGGDMNHMSADKFHQYTKSDETGYIVAFPNGFSRLNGRLATWNAGKCCGKARDYNSDDVGFIKAVIEKISSDLSVDRKKVFITGMSNGGMMSYRLACELTDMIAGIASVAGTDNTTNCSPKKAVSILHIHAKDDDHVLYSGGAGPNSFRNKEQVTDFTSVPFTVEKWVKLNGCNEKPKRVLEKSGAYCDLYSGCRENVYVQLCVTEKGGHSWPREGSPISANDVMWDFFRLNR